MIYQAYYTHLYSRNSQTIPDVSHNLESWAFRSPGFGEMREKMEMVVRLHNSPMTELRSIAGAYQMLGSEQASV